MTIAIVITCIVLSISMFVLIGILGALADLVEEFKRTTYIMISLRDKLFDKNAEIENISDQISSFHMKISDLEDNIDVILSDYTAFDNDIMMINNSINETKDQLQELQSIVNSYVKEAPIFMTKQFNVELVEGAE